MSEQTNTEPRQWLKTNTPVSSVMEESTINPLTQSGATIMANRIERWWLDKGKRAIVYWVGYALYT